MLHNSLHHLLLPLGTPIIPFIVLTETSVIKKSSSIHLLLTDFNGLIRNIPILVHPQIIWNLDRRYFFTINSGEFGIDFHAIWEQGINTCRKGLKVDHGIVLDINVKISFERLSHKLCSLMIVLLTNIEGSIEFQILRIVCL